MIVHGSSLSPFVRKVMVFAAEKGLALENKAAPPGPKTPEFLAISPFGKIPAFEDGDYQLCDSSAIVHYLEAKHPEHRLIPTDPRALGRAIWFDEYADTIMFSAAAPIFFNRVVAFPAISLRLTRRRQRCCRQCSTIWRALFRTAGFWSRIV
jgi:glutathione S-transferase